MKDIPLTGFNYVGVAAELRISGETSEAYGYVVMRTGACMVQAYATADQLRAIALAATVAADELEMRKVTA